MKNPVKNRTNVSCANRNSTLEMLIAHKPSISSCILTLDTLFMWSLEKLCVIILKTWCTRA